jgi:hypothetical protein
MWESSNSWELAIGRTPAPAAVVTDGQKGVLGAITRCWPGTKVQRCHFHIWQNIRAKLTLHPKTPAGAELLGLARVLLRGISNQKDKAQWLHSLDAFGKKYDKELKARTYNPNPNIRKWWYTHGRLRSAYRQLRKLADEQHLFVYLDEIILDPATGEPIPIPRTTNYVEGGINSQLRTKLKAHRGMIKRHQ